MQKTVKIRVLFIRSIVIYNLNFFQRHWNAGVGLLTYSTNINSIVSLSRPIMERPAPYQRLTVAVTIVTVHITPMSVCAFVPNYLTKFKKYGSIMFKVQLRIYT